MSDNDGVELQLNEVTFMDDDDDGMGSELNEVELKFEWADVACSALASRDEEAAML